MEILDLIYNVFSEIEEAKSREDQELVRTLEHKLDHLREELGKRYKTRGNVQSFVTSKGS
jgi:hypothetical protein